MSKQFTFNRKTKTESFADGDGNLHIRGYGALHYDGTPATEYNIGGMFITRFMPGSFSRDRFSDVRAYFNHDPNHVLGREAAETLSLDIDETGLLYDIILPDTQFAKDLYTLVQRGDITGASVTIAPTKEGTNQFRDEEGERYIREFTSVTLFEVGPVTEPAFENTSAVAASAKLMGMDSAIVEIKAAESRKQFEARERELRLKEKISS